MQKSKRGRRRSRGPTLVHKPAPGSLSPRWRDLDQSEQMGIVCNLFCDGVLFTEVARGINKRYSAKLNRESVYPIVRQAVL